MKDCDVTFGIPSVYTPELAEEICARLSAGESLKSICRDPGMPPFSTVQGWARTNHCGFTALYNCARELQAQTFADELIDTVVTALILFDTLNEVLVAYNAAISSFLDTLAFLFITPELISREQWNRVACHHTRSLRAREPHGLDLW